MSVSASTGGMRLAGFSIAARHGAEWRGRRENQTQTGGHQQRPGDEEPARPDPPGDGPDPRRQERQHQPARQPDEPGPERRVAEDALEHDGLVEERHVQAAVDEERRQVDRREGARPEELERDERVRALRHQDREGDQRDDADRDRDPGRRVGPFVRLAADDPERETADGQRRDERPEPVEPAGRLRVARLLRRASASPTARRRAAGR